MDKMAGNMQILGENDIKVDYFVIKIGSLVFSTEQFFKENDIHIAKEQVVNTEGIGIQKNLWIKGNFSEGSFHKKLAKKVPFEVNIYLKR